MAPRPRKSACSRALLIPSTDFTVTARRLISAHFPWKLFATPRYPVGGRFRRVHSSGNRWLIWLIGVACKLVSSHVK
jgi:hypothetical protein